jgi:hypothetical protein
MKGKSIDENKLPHDDSAYISTEISSNLSTNISTRQNQQAGEPLTAAQKHAPTQTQTGQRQRKPNLESTADNLDTDISVDDFLFEKDLDNLEALDEEELLASLEDGSEDAIADHGEDELIDDVYTQQARSLITGSWVDFYGSDSTTYRAKISWMSEDASAFIFVTQTGQIAEKSLAGLSAALRNQQAKVLDESPVFERAMDAVLEGLQ